MARRLWRDAPLLALLLLTHLYFVNEFREFPNTNVRSRIYLTLALVDHHTLFVDDVVRRFGPTQDLALSRGRYYCDKAPGYSFLLAPLAWVLRATVGAHDDIRLMAILLRVFGLSLPAVAFWFCTRGYWRRLAGDDRLGTAVIVAGALGTNFFIYSTQLFAHAAAAMLIFLGVRAAGSNAPRRLALAGALAGLAFTIDYMVAPAIVVLTGWILLRGSSRRLVEAASLAAGGLPLAMLWMTYNWACFGGPLSTGYHHSADPHYLAQYQHGVAGIQVPDAASLFGMTIRPDHGMVYLSPFLLLAPWGWWRLARDRSMPGIAPLSWAYALGIFAFATTTVDWRGGWSVSIRYLVPALPFVFEGVASALHGSRSLLVSVVFRVGAAMGLLQTGVVAATFPSFPTAFRVPIYDMAVPLLLGGHVNGVMWDSECSPLALIPFGLAIIAASIFVLTVAPLGAVERRGRLAFLWMVTIALIGLRALTAPPHDIDRRMAFADVLGKMGYDCDADRAWLDVHQRRLTTQPASPWDLARITDIAACSPCDNVRDLPRARDAAAQLGAIWGDKYAVIWLARAKVLMADGRFNEAMNALTRADALAPADPAMRREIARVREACAESRPYRRAGPGH